MPFSLGAIEASLRINLQQFTEGLKQGAAAAQRSAAELTKTLQVKASVDASSLTAGIKQATDQIQGAAREAAQRWSQSWRAALQAPQAAARQVQTAMTGLWRSSKAGWQDFISGAHAARVAAEGINPALAAMSGAFSGALRVAGGEVAKLAKGLFLAEIAARAVSTAMQKLQQFVHRVVEEVAEDERASLQWARALIRGGQEAGRSFTELRGHFDQIEVQLNTMAARLGVSNRAFLQFTQRAVEAGVPVQQAAKFAETFTLALKGSLGPTERLQVINQELAGIFKGNVEQATRLRERVGTAVLQDFQRLVLVAKDFDAAQALLNEKLKISQHEVEALESLWDTVKGTFDAYMDDLRGSEAGKAFVAGLKGLLGAITDDLKNHRALWATLTSIIQGLATLVQTLVVAIRLIKAPVDLLVGAWQKLAEYAERFQKAVETRMPLPADLQATLGAWEKISQGKGLALTPALTPPLPEAEAPAAAGEPVGMKPEEVRVRLEMEREALIGATAERQKALELAQAQAQVATATAALSGDAVHMAQAEAAGKHLVLAAERALVSAQLERQHAIATLIELDADATKEAKEQAKAVVSELEARAEALGMQGQALDLDRQRAVMQARITVQTQQAQQAAERAQAEGERTLAQMQIAGVSEATLLGQQTALRDQQLAVQQQILQQTKEALAAAGALNATERTRLDQAMQILGVQRQTNLLEAQRQALMAQATHQADLLQLSDQRRQLGLQRQLDLSESQLELAQTQVRMLDLTPAKEQLVLTLVQAEVKERQALAQIQEAQAQATSNALKLQADLVGKTVEERQKLVGTYVNEQEALGNTVTRLQQQLVLLEAARREAIELEKARPFRELAADLVQSARSFVDTIVDGTATMKDALRALTKDLAKSFLDAALKPFWESLQKDLAGGLQRLITGKGPEKALSPEAQALLEAGATQQTAADQWQGVGSQWETVGSQWEAVASQFEAAIGAWQTQIASAPTPGTAPGAWTGEGLTAAMKRWLPEMTKVGAQVGLDPKLLAAVMQVESAGKPGALSPAGAQGLMQLMAGTAKKWGVDAADAFQNVLGGGKELKWLLDRYQGDLDKALVGYNAGPGRADKYGANVPIKETQAYLVKVKAEFERLGGEVSQLGTSTQTAETALPPFTQQVQAATQALQQLAATPGPADGSRAPPQGAFAPATTEAPGALEGWSDIGTLSDEVGTSLSAFADEAATSFETFNEQAGLSFDSFMEAAGGSVASFGDDLLSLGQSLAKQLSRLLGGEGMGGGGWGNLIMGGIGLAFTALSGLLKDTSAQVESLGESAKQGIESTQKTRGLVAGQTEISIAQLSGDLSKAMRPTNDILSQILQVLRQQSGQSSAPVMATGNGGYSFTTEVLGAARV